MYTQQFKENGSDQICWPLTRALVMINNLASSSIFKDDALLTKVKKYKYAFFTFGIENKRGNLKLSGSEKH